MNLELSVVRYASPALCKIKPACLFSVPLSAFFAQDSSDCKKHLKLMQDILSKQDTKITYTKRGKNLLFLVYDETLLQEVLSATDSVRYLEQKGYPQDMGLDGILRELLLRLSVSRAFPHEVGLFLGYPVYDVIAFERDAGRNAKRTAYWQVYGNVEEAEQKAHLYRDCCSKCMKFWSCGVSVSEMCGTYRRFTGGIK